MENERGRWRGGSVHRTVDATAIFSIPGQVYVPRRCSVDVKMGW
jgi:hypothetical protein